MKLKGIKSSKARRVVHERNRSVRAPGDPMLTGHQPKPHADGSLACSGCGAMRYSPAAFAAHLTGGGIRDAEAGVYTVGPSDPWLPQRQPERQQQAADAAGAELRAEQIDAYYEQQKKRGQRVATGGNSSDFFD